ncbi:hypothetical protein FRC01_011374, partial [Tulasnella sp. 417]
VEAPLQPRRLLTLAEPVAADQSQAIVDTPSPSLPLGEYNRDSTESSETSQKSQDPPPTNTAAVATSAHANVPSAALPLSLASIALAPSDRTTSEDLFNGSCGYVDHQTLPSTSASKVSDPVLAALFSYRDRRIGVLQASRVVIPPLPAEPDDTEPKIVKNGSASPVASAENLHQIPATAQVNGIIIRECSRNPARSDFTTGSVLHKSSRKIAPEGVEGIDPAGWRGKSLDEIAVALRRRGAATIPQSTLQARPTPTLSSSDGNTSSISGSSALNQLSPPRSIEPQQDRLWETGASDSSRVFIPPLPALPDDNEPKIVKNDLPSPAASADNLLQIRAADQVHGILTRDRSSNPPRGTFATGSVPYKSSRKIAIQGLDVIDPAGWRGRSLEEIAETLRRRGGATVPQSIPQATPAPTLSSSHENTSSISGSPALNHSTSIGFRQDLRWEAGTPNYSPYSTFEPRSDTPAQEAENVVPKLPDSGEEPTVESCRDDVPWQVQSTSRLGWGRKIRANLRQNARSSELNEEWRWAKTKGKTPVAGRSGSAPPTPVSTDDEEDEVDSEGFSRSEQRKAEAASRAALAIPFYGATTSLTMQPLSDDEWSSLEQYAATPASLTELAQPQVPLSTGMETDVVQTLVPPPPPPPAVSTDIVTGVEPTWALPPPPPPHAAPKAKGASRTQKFIKKVVKRVKSTLRPKTRSRATGDD